MFGIGMTEMLLILVVVLIVIGPKRLPEVAKALGKGLAEFKRASDEFRNAMHSELQDREEGHGKGIAESPDSQPRIGATEPDRDDSEADEPHPLLALDNGEQTDEKRGKS